jgi:hypothetical protein
VRASSSARTWVALGEANAAYYTVLRFRIDNPGVPAAQAAEQLSARMGKPVTAAWFRKTLQRAHEKYADLLIEEVAVSLQESAPALLEQELRELDLMKYCGQALQRRKERSGRGANLSPSGEE